MPVFSFDWARCIASHSGSTRRGKTEVETAIDVTINRLIINKHEIRVVYTLCMCIRVYTQRRGLLIVDPTMEWRVIIFGFAKKWCRAFKIFILYIWARTHSRKRSFFAVYSLIMHILRGKGSGIWLFHFSIFSIRCKLISNSDERM